MQSTVNKPKDAECRYRAAVGFYRQRLLIQSLDAAQQAVTLAGDNAKYQFLLGLALEEIGNVKEAQSIYQRVVELDPNHAGAWHNLGNCLKHYDRIQEAIAAYKRCVDIRPNDSFAHYSLGGALELTGDPEHSILCYKKAVQLDEDFTPALVALILRKLDHVEWKDLKALTEKLFQAIQKTPYPLSVSGFHRISESAEMHYLVAKARSLEIAQRVGTTDNTFHFHKNKKSQLVIGYLSGDFRDHVITRLAVELFELHDRKRFRVLAYSYGQNDGSALRNRLIDAFDKFTDIRDSSIQESAQRIYNDTVDILVDLNGYAGQCRPEIVALRPAPIQVNFWGMPGTTGSDCLDYIICDQYLVPPMLAHFYSEKPVYMPDCHQVNNASTRPTELRTTTRVEFGLPEEGFVFACFNRPYKIIPPVFDVWMRLLRSVQGSVLWMLVNTPSVADRLRRESASRDVDPNRLVFSGVSTLAEHLARYQHVDLFLDTFPYNAGSTAGDTIWMGCPIVTCSGDTYVSRTAGSVLNAVGVPELITTSFNDYEALALRLAIHPDELKSVRRKIVQNRDTSPLFNSLRFTRNMERAYENMWEIYLKGEEPRSFKVDPPDEALC